MDRRGDADQRSVMGLVIRRLYFGRALTDKERGMNGSILKQWRRKGYDWETLARVVEGLAVRRDNGELYGVGRMEPVSLRWIQSKNQMLNQLAVCLDAECGAKVVKEQREQASSRVVETLADILKQYGKGA